jgi:hypothetical protein
MSSSGSKRSCGTFAFRCLTTNLCADDSTSLADYCRKRRIRCDSADRCGNCTRLNKYCTYPKDGSASPCRGSTRKKHHAPKNEDTGAAMPLMPDIQGENFLRSTEQEPLGHIWDSASQTLGQQPQQPYGPYGYTLNSNLALPSHTLPSPSEPWTACGTTSLPDWTYDPQASVQETPTAGAMTLSRSTSSDQTLVRDMRLGPPMSCQSGDHPNKMLSLTIVGDLNAMCNGWSSHEVNKARRLVEFERSQTGSAITATFKAITQDEYSPNMMCVSCCWAQNTGYYVTRVDIITLAEALRPVCYTVEEKEVICQTLEDFIPWARLGNVLHVSDTSYNGVKKLIIPLISLYLQRCPRQCCRPT